MYTPEIYKNENKEEIEKFIKENGFGILINQVSQKFLATHIPLELDVNEKNISILSGHISLENPQWKSFKNNEDVLVIFSGPHAYISSSWYDHENVPTWNYIAVHVYGKIKIIEGELVINSLKKLVDKYEKKSENPVSIEKFSKKTMLQAKGIVAFEIAISEIQATKKMSQNRDSKNYLNIIAELDKNNDFQSKMTALEMKKCPI